MIASVGITGLKFFLSTELPMKIPIALSIYFLIVEEMGVQMPSVGIASWSQISS